MTALSIGIVRVVHAVSMSMQKPALVCDQPVHDFGVMQPGDQAIHGFVLRNRGTKPIAILQVTPGCGGCVEVLEYPGAPIPPKESRKIKLKLLTDGRSNAVSKVVLVKSDDRLMTTMPLTLKAGGSKRP